MTAPVFRWTELIDRSRFADDLDAWAMRQGSVDEFFPAFDDERACDENDEEKEEDDHDSTDEDEDE